MNKPYKIALALLLSTHAALWASSEPKPYDLTENGMCFSMHNDNVLPGLQDLYSQQHRGVSFDGGGIRGIMEAVWAVSIEDAANSEYRSLSTNEEKIHFLERTGIYKRRQKLAKDKVIPNGDIRFQDFFDYAAGTSTGSICAAALFHKDRFRAKELLNLYLNMSVELFDLQKQKSSAGGLYTSRYSSAGLKGLLSAYFGDSKMEGAFDKKIVYFGLTNETTGSLELATNQEVDHDTHPGSIRDYAYHTLVDIVSTSCSAPTYFDATDLVIEGNITNQFSDGGLSANSPGDVAYKSEERKNRYTEEMYVFGTGGCGTSSVRKKNAGAYEAEKYISTAISSNTSASIYSLKSEVKSTISQLRKFFRINASLQPDEQKLDDTSPEYLKLLMEKSYACTSTDVFQHMMSNLGLNKNHLPSLDDIKLRANALDQTFVDNVKSKKDFNKGSKEDYILRHCLRRVRALDEQWFSSGTIDIMDNNGSITSPRTPPSSFDFLKQLKKHAKRTKKNKEIKILETYFLAQQYLPKPAHYISSEALETSSTNESIDYAKEMLQQKAQNSWAYKSMAGVTEIASSVLSVIMGCYYPITAEESTSATECEEHTTNSCVNFHRYEEEEEEKERENIERELLRGWVNGDLSKEDKSMWTIINNYLGYLSAAGMNNSNCPDGLKIASTLYVNTFFSEVAQAQLEDFYKQLKMLTEYLANEKPLSSFTSVAKTILKNLTLDGLIGSTRLTSLLEAIDRRIKKQPCLEDSQTLLAEEDSSATEENGAPTAGGN